MPPVDERTYRPTHKEAYPIRAQPKKAKECEEALRETLQRVSGKEKKEHTPKERRGKKGGERIKKREKTKKQGPESPAAVYNYQNKKKIRPKERGGCRSHASKKNVRNEKVSRSPRNRSD